MARFVAWINAVPEGEEAPRHELIKEIKKPKRVTCQYLFEYFTLLIKGTNQITFTELVNFEKLMGVKFQPLEAELLIDMGQTYNGFIRKASNPKCENPFATKEDITNKKMLNIKAHMKAIRIRKQGER